MIGGYPIHSPLKDCSIHQTDRAIRIRHHFGVYLRVPTWICVILLLIAQAALLAHSATLHSPTFNEPAHLVAGICNWQFGRFDLYRVNPPLTRMIAALPVVLHGCKFDWSRSQGGPNHRPEFNVGADFIKSNREESLRLLVYARWACIPLTLLGGVVTFAWGSELYGRKSGLLAQALWTFSPSVLAHGELITGDMAAASFGLLACFTFWRWLKSRTLIRATIAGCCLGLASLSKLIWFGGCLIWPIVFVLYTVSLTPRRPVKLLAGDLGQLALILALSTYSVCVSYGFEGVFVSLGQYRFVSRLLSGRADLRINETDNRFVAGPFGSIPIPLPREYVAGIDEQMADSDHFGKSNFLAGVWNKNGWWYYYLYGLLVKVPHGTQLICAASLLLWFRDGAETRRDEICIIVPAAVILIILSAHSSINQHFRYALPVLGLGIVFSSRLLSDRLSAATLKYRSILADLCVTCTALSTLSAYPHQLAYFNELSGGLRNGRSQMLHSSLDWGQDMLFLRDWLTRNGSPRCGVVFYGKYDPHWIGIDCCLPPFDSRASELCGNHCDPTVIAIGANQLMGDREPAPGRCGAGWTMPSDESSRYRNQTPLAVIGYSLFVFPFGTESSPHETRPTGQSDHEVPSESN